MSVARFYIVRHGETDANRQRIIQGHLDTELNAAGIEQAQLTANALANIPFTAAYTSDLKRAHKTAEIILAKQENGPVLTPHEDLRERNMGDLQGKLYRGHAGGWTESPNMESVADLQTRTIRLWNRLVQRHVLAKREETPVNVLVTSHGGFIGVLIESLIGSRKVRCAEGVSIGRCLNASITVVEVEASGRGEVISYADTVHLDVDLVQVNADSDVIT